MNKCSLQRKGISAWFWGKTGEIVSFTKTGIQIIQQGKKRRIAYERLTTLPHASTRLFWSGIRFSTEQEQFHFIGYPAKAVDEWLNRIHAHLSEITRHENETLLKSIEGLLSQVAELKKGSQYLRHSQILLWCKEGKRFIRRAEHPVLHHFWRQSDAKKIDRLHQEIKDAPRWLKKANHRFLSRAYESYHSFFDSFNEQPLTEKQRLACLRNEDNNLILAGAGSGKTSTLLSRAGYLVAAKLVLPEQILLLAFAKEAANEMVSRQKQRQQTEFDLQLQKVSIKTFHSLGMEIIYRATGKMPSLSSLSENKTSLQAFITSQIEQLSRNHTYQKQLNQFIAEQNDIRTKADVVSLFADYLVLFRQSIEKTSSDLASNDQDNLFQQLFSPVANVYMTYLGQQGEIDFPGMIQEAISLIESGRYRSPFLHILVDEFQDISPDRKRLIDALKKQNAETVLFAVGDDWQSIYRFAGSDIQITKHFEKMFGATSVTALDQTFRFNNQIADVSSAFIQKNTAQRKKEMVSLRQEKRAAVFLVPESKATYGFWRVMQQISDSLLPDQTTTILILARFKFHLSAFQTESFIEAFNQRFPNIHFTCMTVHAAKGKEADYVLIIGVESGDYGFPAEKEDNPILQWIMPEKEDYPFAEERRLFYVALTRAKHQVYLIYDRNKPSSFVKEIAQENRQRVVMLQSD